VGDERFTSHDESYLYLFCLAGQEENEELTRQPWLNGARPSVRLLLLGLRTLMAFP
jgi:hypothetical protein